MNSETVTMVRIYMTEGDAHLNKILRQLHDEEKVKGVTVFRGISGFGQSGEIHSSSLLDMSLNLPVVVEFFDIPDKVNDILSKLEGQVKPGHVVSWQANVNV